MSSSTKIDNRKKDILILGKDPTHLSLHYNRTNSYLFVNGKEIFLNSKQKILRLYQLRYV